MGRFFCIKNGKKRNRWSMWLCGHNQVVDQGLGQNANAKKTNKNMGVCDFI